MMSPQDYQDLMLTELSDSQKRFAILKRGSVVNERFFELSTAAKAALIPIMNLLVLGKGDVIQGGGLIDLPQSYFEAFGFSYAEIRRALPELCENGFIAHVTDDVYRILNSWN